MLASISQREFREWQAFWNISPFGQDVEDERFARVISLHANVNRKKGAKPFTSADFMLNQYRDKPTSSVTVGQALKAMAGVKDG